MTIGTNRRGVGWIEESCEMGFDSWSDPFYGDSVNARLTLDRAGRVVIPEGLREKLHLEAGDEFELETAGQEITLRPVRKTAPLARERGVWVFRTARPLPASATDETLRTIREERNSANVPPSK